MESPERSESIPAPVDQGSPFFKYLCNLSPIKPARSVHVVQTYAELSMPPPPAVFTSPPNPSKCNGRVRRGLVVSRVEAVGVIGHSAWSTDKENNPNAPYVSRSFPTTQPDPEHHSPHVTHEHCQHLTPQQLEHEEGCGPCPTGDTPTKYEYGDVADYLADPVEGGMYAVAKSYSYMLRSSQGSEVFDYQDGGHNVGHRQVESLSSEQANLSECSEDIAQDVSRSSAVLPKVADNGNQYQPREDVEKERRESSASRVSGSCSDHVHGNCSENSGSEESLELDQETAAMAFLLVGDVDGEEGSINDWSAATQSALSEFTRQQTPDMVALESMSKLTQSKMGDVFEAAVSEAILNETSTGADTRDSDVEDRKDGGGPLSQRGVRRRCLDFETSVRRKSMGGGVSRKSLGLRPKSVPGTTDAGTSRSIPPSILCERAVATSDATNSGQGAGAGLDVPSDLSRSEANKSGTKVLSPGLLRLSRCTFQRSAEGSASDKVCVEASRTLRDSGNPPASVGIPSGIGLHLNSLTGSISFSPNNRELKHSLNIGSATKGAVASLLGISGLAGSSNESGSENFGRSLGMLQSGSKSYTMASTTPNFGSGVMISLMERSRVSLRETPPIAEVPRGLPKINALHSLTVGGRQSLEGGRSSGVDVLDKKFGTIGKKRLLHQDVLQQSSVDFTDEYDSPRSPKKRRKSPASTGEKSEGGCKRCNCKKSKCLKLYCECFAAGTYCVGSCTCHDCFNKPEHGEMVFTTRQQIESRNPLAFAPKIIHGSDASPKRGEEIVDTPASARHKRGCNCKKSQCLKKYCECYQAGVGCSEGCRCEGCKNMYGRKEAIEENDDKEIALEVQEKGSEEDHDALPKPGCQGGAGRMDYQHNNGKDLSPITPSVQYAGSGRTVGRVRSSGKKRSSSPLSQPQSGPKPSRSPMSTTTRSSMFPQSSSISQQTPDVQLSKHGRSPMSTPKFSRMNQLSPRWDGLGDICTLTPLPQPPLRPTPASIPTLDRAGASPSFNRQSNEPISSYRGDVAEFTSKPSAQSFHQSTNHSSPSSHDRNFQTSSSRHQTPCTPCVSSSAFAGKDITKVGDCRSGHLSSFDDDDTPDFLRYSEEMPSPLISKTSSPKQKRVSPPHFDGVREKARGDGRRHSFDSPARSSPGLRSGRKFILQALPSLPPVIPLVNPGLQGQSASNLKNG